MFKIKESILKSKLKTVTTRKTTSDSSVLETKNKIIMKEDDSFTTSSSTSIMLFRLHHRLMKVNHIECEEKVICKAQRN